jgi:glycosyltransferase involved in cell wall biosynthesis
VLVVANRVPYPLEDGWKRRTFHVLRAIAASRPVTLATLHDGDSAVIRELAGHLPGDVQVLAVKPPRGAKPVALVRGVVTRTPYHVWKLRSRALREAIEAAIGREPHDIAIATMAHLYPYLAGLPHDVARVVDTHNVDSLVMERYAARIRGRMERAYARRTATRLRAHEERVYAAADRVWVCSETEVRDVLARAPHAAVRVVPNGVDAHGEFAPRDATPHPRRVLFFGRLDYYPNRDAVEFFVASILPLIRRVLPDVEFSVVGPGGDVLRPLLAADPGCRLIGPADDLAAMVAAAALVVVPLRMGGGTRLKILEALALRRPVVSTRIGAEGLSLEPGRDLVLEDDPPAFAGAVVDLLTHPERAAALGASGRLAVEEQYDWRRIEQRIRDELGLADARVITREAPAAQRRN